MIKRLGCGTLLLLLIAAGLVMWGLIGYSDTYERLIDVEDAWSQVRLLYQQRADMVPRLVKEARAAGYSGRAEVTAVREARASVSELLIGPSTTSIPREFQRFVRRQAALARALDDYFDRVQPSLPAGPRAEVERLRARREELEAELVDAARSFDAAVELYQATLSRLPQRLFQNSLFRHRVRFADVEAPRPREAPADRTG